MTKTIVVTGATGQVGGAVVKALAAEGFQVRAASRNPGAYLASGNVSAVKLDYHDLETVAPALSGADGLFLIALPLDPEAAEVLAPIIDRAKAAGIGQIVLHSALGVDMNEAAPLRKVERHLMASGVPYTILRSNFFMDNLVTGFLAPMITGEDGIFLPAGEGRTSFIATGDIAAVAATAFRKGLVGTEYNLTGPEALDHYQVAEIISEVAGRKITYHPVPEGHFLALLRELGLTETAARYLTELYGFVREGYMSRETADVQEVTGRAPTRFVAFAAEHRDDWKAAGEKTIPYAAETLIGRPFEKHLHG